MNPKLVLTAGMMGLHAMTRQSGVQTMLAQSPIPPPASPSGGIALDVLATTEDVGLDREFGVPWAVAPVPPSTQQALTLPSQQPTTPAKLVQAAWPAAIPVAVIALSMWKPQWKFDIPMPPSDNDRQVHLPHGFSPGHLSKNGGTISVSIGRETNPGHHPFTIELSRSLLHAQPCADAQNGPFAGIKRAVRVFLHQVHPNPEPEGGVVLKGAASLGGVGQFPLPEKKLPPPKNYPAVVMDLVLTTLSLARAYFT